MLSLDYLNGKQRFTKISIFILIPKIEMLLYCLVVREACRMMSTPHKIIGWWENMFATFTFCISSAFDKEECQLSWHMWLFMPMSIKCTNHKLKECIFHLFWETTVLNHLWKCAINVVCTTIPEPRISISWTTITSAYFALYLTQSEKIYRKINNVQLSTFYHITCQKN